MPRSELDAYSRLYLSHGLLSTWDGAVTLLAGSGVGGGTLMARRVSRMVLAEGRSG